MILRVTIDKMSLFAICHNNTWKSHSELVLEMSRDVEYPVSKCLATLLFVNMTSLVKGISRGMVPWIPGSGVKWKYNIMYICTRTIVFTVYYYLQNYLIPQTIPLPLPLSFCLRSANLSTIPSEYYRQPRASLYAPESTI